MQTAQFLATHPVFSLEEATDALAPRGGRRGAVERLKHYLQTGRLKLVEREVYATVPPGVEPQRYRPDAFLAAAAVRRDAVFSHHSALELLGVAHSAWHVVTAYTSRRRRPVELGNATLRFLEHPPPFRRAAERRFAARRMEHLGSLLWATGPERTLAEGFRHPDLVGGLEELLNSAGGFPTLDLDLLEAVLRRYGVANLWAATGWFLERFRETFCVSDGFLRRLERRRPKQPQYLVRRRRSEGKLFPRWNLLVPYELVSAGEPDES